MHVDYRDQGYEERRRIAEAFLIDEKKLDRNLRLQAVVQEYFYSGVHKFSDLEEREQLHVCGVFLRALDDLERDDFVLDIGKEDLGECVARYMTDVAVLPLNPAGDSPKDRYAEFGHTMLHGVLSTCADAIQEEFDDQKRKFDNAADAA